MPKFNFEKNLDHGILFTTAGTKLPFNQPIFPSVFRGFLYIIFQHIIATHDVSHV